MLSKYSYESDISPLVKLAVPITLTGTVQSATWFFQTLFLSHLGEKSLAAGALVSWLFGTVAIILFGALSSINILVAHKHGAKDQTGITYVARDGMVLAIFFSMITSLLLWNVAPIFLLLGQSQEVVEIARPYVHALCYGMPAVFLQMACLEVLMGLGKARVILFFTTVTVVLNVIASYLFIFGKFGVPQMDVAGAGWGMTVSYWLALIALLFYLYINKPLRAYFSHAHKFDTTSYLWELFAVGFPTGLMYCAEVAFFFALTVCMGMLGTQEQAANQVALQYLGLVMSTMFAVSQAITVRMGHLLGAGEPHAAEKASHIGIVIALMFISCVAVVYWVFPSALISIDFDIHAPQNVAIVNEITAILGVSAVFQMVETVRVSLFGALRGLKDTRFTLLASIISFWCIGLPFGYIFAMKFGVGVTGYWWAMVMGATVSVLLLQWRFRSKMKHYYHFEHRSL